MLFTPLLTIIISGCSSMSPLPESTNVRISREDADPNCRFLSKVEGRVASIKGTRDEALKDLQQEAANKGANFLIVKEYSGSGSVVTGLAYFCP